MSLEISTCHHPQQWRDKCDKELALDPDSVFTKMGNYGLLSFSDYLFLLTLLASMCMCTLYS